MTIYEDGLKDFARYQAARAIIKVGKDQAKDEFRKDPSMSWDDYVKRRSQYRFDFKKRKMIELGDLMIDNRGHLKYRGKKPQEKIKKVTGVSTKRFFRSLSLSPSLTRIRIKTEIIKNISLKYKQWYEGRWEAWLEFSIRF